MVLNDVSHILQPTAAQVILMLLEDFPDLVVGSWYCLPSRGFISFYNMSVSYRAVWDTRLDHTVNDVLKGLNVFVITEMNSQRDSLTSHGWYTHHDGPPPSGHGLWGQQPDCPSPPPEEHRIKIQWTSHKISMSINNFRSCKSFLCLQILNFCLFFPQIVLVFLFLIVFSKYDC